MTKMNDLAKRIIDAKQEIAQSCAQDADFREAFLANPKEVLLKKYNLPEDALDNLTLRPIVEEQGEVVISIGPDSSEVALTDDQLDLVAGGFAFSWAVTGAALGVLAAAGKLTYQVGSMVNTSNERKGKDHW